MTSRQRKYTSTVSSQTDETRSSKARPLGRKLSRNQRRRNLLETLEPRQLLAGPQLIGIQPNVGELITEGSTVETAPRTLTLRFDQDQNIDPGTFDAVRISRAGDDGELGTPDDVQIVPALVSLADSANNEVVVRFGEALPDDQYKVEVFGYDDPSKGIVGLRNNFNELLQPSVIGQRVDTTRFNLKLGALIEAVVPQPVIRQSDGTLRQNRDEIVVYFNEDPLFVENDDSGNPTIRSAEHPRFYQLLLTQETVRNSDDALYHPDEVIYDSATNTARLIFAQDLNELGQDVDGNSGVSIEGGTFRLRIGTAVDDRVDVILPPLQTEVEASAVVDFGVEGLQLRFVEQSGIGEGSTGRQISFVNGLGGGLSHTLGVGPRGEVVFDFGGASPTIQDLVDYIADPVNGLVTEIDLLATPQNTADLAITDLPSRLIDSPAITLSAVGDTLGEAFQVGVFGQGGQLTSLLLSESIDPQTVVIQPRGSDFDPGGDERFTHINPDFGADDAAGVTDVAYNFQGIFATVDGVNYLNQITEVEKTRIREALGLWSANIGVQFRETESDGITFAVGDDSKLEDLGPDTNLTSAFNLSLNATLRIPADPNNLGYTDAALVFDKSTDFNLDYGEDFTRKSVAGIGLLLGLEPAADLLSTSDAGDLTSAGDATPTIMGLSAGYLNASIESLSDLEPVFPNNYDVLHGQYLHRTDSVDIDLYQFVVDLDDPTQVGTLTAETFSERLADSSLLDTELTLFEEVSAGIVTDLGLGSDMALSISSLMPGRLGNNSSISFVQSDRLAGDTGIRVLQSSDRLGNPSANGILIDLPRLGPNIAEVFLGDLVDAINNHPFASSIFRASVIVGDANTDIGEADLPTFSPLLLSGGGIEKVHRNDNYFGEDSRIIASLGEGVYYLGVAASGNDQYDPTIPGTGNGGRTQGEYELHLKFEPQVDELDVIRDQDGVREGVPGTTIDGDGDGVPGGVHNFWFQTRSLERKVLVQGDGQRVTEGQVMTITSGSSVVRDYEFVTAAGNGAPGSIEVVYSLVDTPLQLAEALRDQINIQTVNTDVTVEVDNTSGIPVLVFSGERSVDLSADFAGMEVIGRTIFVDKIAGPFAEGTLERPFNNVSNSAVANAFGSSAYGDIVRIVGNGGLDNDLTTESDNLSYQIGTAETGGSALTDGRAMNVPSGVTTMIDAGAVFKLRNSYINVGSSTVQVDRSNGALQILGTPRLINLSLSGQPIETTLLGEDDQVSTVGYSDGSVIFTSTRDRLVDTASSGISADASPGNWGGIVFRRDIDRAEGRRDREDDGIFMQTVNHAEIRYGGGSNVLIDSVQQLVNPVQIVDMRPTVTFNQITFSADSAISAAPNSFEETSFQAPQYQQGGVFTADYDRIGPEIHSNLLVENSINGLFIRVTTTPVDPPKEFTVAARFDDTDIVHYVAENLTVVGAPGGSIEDGVIPSWQNVTWQPLSSGSLVGGDTYEYKLTFVDADGFESIASLPFSTTIPATFTNGASVEFTALPTVGSLEDYVSRRLYRADAAGDFFLVASLDAGSISFIDDGSQEAAFLDPTHQGIRGRLDASLVMDAGLIVKLRGSRIELQHGTQMLAEANLNNPIVFTSSLDDRFGVGGTFDTNNDGSDTAASRGDWSGIYASPNSTLSLDHVVLANAGGISLLRGGLARGFAPVELVQAEGRITHSRFETNDTGQDGAGPAGRFGLLSLNGGFAARDAISTIMVRGSQPVVVGNTFYDNRGTIINIDIESMGADHRVDPGRSTGEIDRLSGLDDNYGPLIRYNRYDNIVFEGPGQNDSNSQLSGLEVRSGLISTATVFDDTDIAHLIFDNIEVGNFHSSGGLRLMSRPDESLVVKFTGSGSPNSAHEGTGLTASGQIGNTNRIGGAVHVIGLPGAPVVLTSIHDDSVGAGMSPSGSSFTDHDGDGVSSRPMPNDWRGILLDQFSNDNNILVLPELELLTEVPPGLNASVDNAQYLGELAKEVVTADHARRAGFEVQGYLGGTTDVDAYSFTASPGTPVWVDIDSTSFTLDTVIEVLDADGVVLARSDNSFDETAATNPTQVSIFDNSLDDGVTRSLQVDPEFYTDRNDFGLYSDFGSYNPRDAGIHFSLPGNSTDPSARSVYFVRVRSASLNPDDSAGGVTGGHYRMQVRLTEEQAFPGSLVRYANIRYANHGIHAQGLMSNSPLLGEAQENEVAVQAEFAPDFVTGGFQAYNNTPVGGALGSGAQFVGNLSSNNQGVIGIGGTIGNPPSFLNDPFAYNADDVDFYQFEVDGVQSAVFDVDFADGYDRYDTNISIFYDADGAPLAGELSNDAPSLIFFGSASNVLDDLPSALGENSELEKLVRGSLTTNDPFVGPVALASLGGFGTYYVAITESDRQPSSLNLGNVVREPINSITRLVEDRFEDEASTTDVDAVTVSDLFDRLDPASTVNDPTTAFGIGFDSIFGHGKPAGFLTTTAPNPSGVGTDTVFAHVAPTPTPPITPPADPANEYDPDDTNIDPPTNLDPQAWSLVETDTIGTVATLLGGAENTSTAIPHLSVNGSLSDADAADFFQVSIPDGGGSLTIDIDGGFDLGASIDTKVHVFSLDAFGGPQNAVFVTGNGGIGGSGMVEDGMLGSLSVNDPFATLPLFGGAYLIAVMGQDSVVNYVQGNTPPESEITVASDGSSGDYVMRLSLDTKAATITTADVGNAEDFLEFDRSKVSDSSVTYEQGLTSLFTSGNDEISITHPPASTEIRYLDIADADAALDLPPTANLAGGVLTVTYNSLAATATNADYNAVVGAINGAAGFTANLVDPASGTVLFPAGLESGYFSISYAGESATVFVSNVGFFGPADATIEITSAAPGLSDYTVVFDDSETDDVPPAVDFNPFLRTLTIVYNPLAQPGSLNRYGTLVAIIDDLPEFNASLVNTNPFSRLPALVAVSEKVGTIANYNNVTSGHSLTIENTAGTSFRFDILEVPGSPDLQVIHDNFATGTLQVFVGTDNGATYQDVIDAINALVDFTATLTAGANTALIPLGQESILTAVNSFDLSNYVAADQPHLYYNRLLELGIDDSASITLQSQENLDNGLDPVELATYLSLDNSSWQQERIDLSAFAGHTNLQLSVVYTNGIGITGSGLGIDDVIVGFAERGEQIFRAVKGTSFVDIDPFNDPKPPYNGEYQLEIRKATEFASGSVFNVTVDDNFDTNDRLTQATTMVVPDPVLVSDGDTFLLSDGVSTQVFEFDNNSSIGFGHIRVDMTAVTTTAELASQIRDSINGQSVIAVEATTAGGLDGSELGGGQATGDRLALSGVRLGSFEESTLGSNPLNQDSEGHLLMPVIFYDGFGDTNFERNQGVVLVEHNQISDVRGIGIWSEPGSRDTSPYQDLPFLADVFDLYFSPQVANAHPGGVINLPELNDSVLGGLTPGIVIESNTIDQAEYAGIKVDGQTAPWVIEVGTGDTVSDGTTFVIDAAGTRVIFEFEEIGEGAEGSGAATGGGDGVRDGHVPVYYRHNDDTPPVSYFGRLLEYSELEMVHAIRESIQGSILMTNGLVELVEVEVGPSLTAPIYTAGSLDSDGAPVGPAIVSPALYIQGASGIYPSVQGGIPGVTANILSYQAPVAEAPQPFARVVNNTIYGDDGTRSFTEGSAAEPNDLFIDAVDTRISGSHRDDYSVTAVLGDNGGLQSPTTDVDLYRVYLEVGDRLISDIDTAGAGAPNTAMQIFDASGTVQSFVDTDGVTRTVSSSDVGPPVLTGNGETGVGEDPYIDFVAPKSGVYFVGVSSEGNNSYSGRTLSNRQPGFGGTGSYNLSLRSYAPRSFVMSFDGDTAENGTGNSDRDQAGVQGLVGTTFTVTTIEDIPAAFPQGNGTNQVTFRFNGGAAASVSGGVVNVPIGSGEVHDLMRGIELAFGVIGFGLPVLPNYDLSNFPESRIPGAVRAGKATALGGASGQTRIGDEMPWFFFEQIGIPIDNNTSHPDTGALVGFGHNKSGGGNGTTELYAFIENVARIELSEAAIAAGLTLDPVAGEDADQLLNETGIMIAGGSSPTILNNVFMNLHEAVAVERTNGLLGLESFGSSLSHPKPSEVIVVGNIFQDVYLASRADNTAAQDTLGVNHFSLTGFFDGTSNVNGGNDDFNLTLLPSDLSLQHPEANNFQPAYGSVIIDSSVNSLIERDGYVTVREAVGLGVTNVLAPTSDVSGVLRADHPDFASLGGIGASVFKDRGSVELADFVGPIAIAEMPRDNDAAGIDLDPTISVINLADGVYRDFRIQLRDNGDSSDPFTGIGLDDSTVVVPVIEGLRPAGSNVTLLENDRLLAEGVDYTFYYDETRKLITLTPLTGVWQNDRSYRIEINNQDRDVLVAPAASEVTDGDQLTIVDSQGGEIVFEFESGYSLFVPEPITLVVPRAGTDIGGISDGDLFQLNDGINIPVIFEFNAPGGSTLPGTVAIPLPTQATPADEVDLQVFLNEIAVSMEEAIQTKIDDESLDIDVRVLGGRVVIGGEPGATAITALSGLQQLSRTLGLQVPQSGVGPGGISDGDSFRLDNGSGSPISFEFDTLGDGVGTAQNRLVDVQFSTTAEEVAAAIRDSILASGLGIEATVEGDGRTVFLGLPESGDAIVSSGRLEVVGLSRPPLDGDTITISPSDDSDPVILEINRTDEEDGSGGTIDDGVATDNFSVDVTRLTTADELSALIANAMQSLTSVAGLNQDEITVINGGLLAVGGQEGLGLDVDGYSMSVTGSPSVTGPSTVAINGPLILALPLVGGGGIVDGSVLVLKDDLDNDVVFEFNLAGTAPTYPGSIPVLYNSFDTVDVIVVNLTAAINSAGTGITATAQAVGRVSLGRVSEDRVNINGIFDPTGVITPASGLSGATLRRDIVRDGEILEITQGATTVRYEFETASGGGGVAAGNVAVPFQPGSTPADVATSLAASINNTLGGLTLDAVVVLDPISGLPTGGVTLNDIPGTIVDISAAPTLELSGVPGGATPIQYSPSFGTTEMKFAMISAINSVNVDGEPAVTPITADDRGGSSFFVANAEFFGGVADLDGYVENFFLPGVKDEAGNLLRPNRSDLTTQFSILMPTASFDYGDAPDPLYGVAGRYPTTAANNGPRHVLGGTLMLGTKVDANPDGLPGVSAKGDDLAIGITSSGTLFTTTIDGGAVIEIDTSAVDPTTRDGDTITIDLGTVQETLEFDVATSNLGAFDEDNYAIRPTDATSADSIAEAIRLAIIESPLRPASVSVESVSATEAKVIVGADDEDGVIFESEENPYGVLNRGVALPIDVSVTGGGVLEAWIDFNADGDWDDPGEQIIPQPNTASFIALRNDLLPEELRGVVSNVFSDTGGVSTRTFGIVVPETAPIPPTAVTTYARFRISQEGGLSPQGLALSGEVEDYAIEILPGLPPTISEAQSSLSYSVTEDQDLDVSDVALGLLNGISDPDLDDVAIFAGDLLPKPVTDSFGENAGTVTINDDGTFLYVPETNYFGTFSFTARVTDVHPSAPETQLVSPTALTVTVTVNPDNDAPTAIAPPVVYETGDLDEDALTTFEATDLIDPFYQSGPANESDQALLFSTAFSVQGALKTVQGGTLTIAADGRSMEYTPPADYFGDDEFSYTVIDSPAAGQTALESLDIGTVEITLTAVNDPPRPGEDNVSTTENVAVTIAISNLLSNDTAGPGNETGQSVEFVSFEAVSAQGGTIERDGDDLIYTPANQFSGEDQFTYRIAETGNPTSFADGTVVVTVIPVNDPPVFIGQDGVLGYQPLTDDLSFIESKAVPQTLTYDLNDWFTEPDLEAMTFAVTSADTVAVDASVLAGTSTLQIVLPSYGGVPDPVELTVTASDTADPGNVNATSQAIQVTVTDTPDSPQLDNPIVQITVPEDTVGISVQMSDIFSDPDGDTLNYTYQIASNSLVQSITFPNGVMQIVLQDDANGSVDITIIASDGSSSVSDTFTLNVTPVEDDPIAEPDSYSVALGSVLQVQDPQFGVLANDFDADGDNITVDLNSIVYPTLGDLAMNPSGIFVYTNNIGDVGDTDEFSYRITDGVRFSGFVTVTISLTSSSYQNPILEADVNADGRVSAIDALRVINFLTRRLTGSETSIPVNEIGSAPPDYLDVNGNGSVSASDALEVINALEANNNAGGEQIASFAVTSSMVSASTLGFPVRNFDSVDTSAESSVDRLFAGQIEIDNSPAGDVADWFAESNEGGNTNSDASDEALSSILGDNDLQLEF